MLSSKNIGIPALHISLSRIAYLQSFAEACLPVFLLTSLCSSCCSLHDRYSLMSKMLVRKGSATEETGKSWSACIHSDCDVCHCVAMHCRVGLPGHPDPSQPRHWFRFVLVLHYHQSYQSHSAFFFVLVAIRTLAMYSLKQRFPAWDATPPGVKGGISKGDKVACVD